MASHSVSRYHAHFRTQDREEEMKQRAFCLLLLENIVSLE